MDQQDGERQKIFRVVYNKVMNGHIHIRGFLKILNFIHTDHSSHVETVILLSRK